MRYLNGESEIRMARRHFRHGEACIRRQLALITNLRERGLPTDNAEAVLFWMDEVQRQFETDYEHIKRKILADLEGTTDAHSLDHVDAQGPERRAPSC